MKKVISMIVAVLMLAGVLAGCSAGEEQQELNILNWGDYIDMDLLDRFEEETGIKVNYMTMASNEEMLVKIDSPDSVFDLVFPSDYLIERMIREELVQPINYDNIPNVEHIDERFMNLSFDPDNTYSIPYMWGTLGILYNTTKVTEPVTSWDILWDDQYAGEIFMYDSIRDSMSVSLKRLGYSLNTPTEAEIIEARDQLIAQKPLVKAFLGDPMKDRLISGEGAMGVVYSGDAMVCIAENPDLAYALPEEGSNMWFDNIVIPTSAQNVSAAEQFINFLCDPEVAKINTEYIGYSSPNASAVALLDEELRNDITYNPPAELTDNCEVHEDLGDALELYNDAWVQVKGA